MGITVYSLAISIVFYNLALIAVFILRRSPGFRARHTVSLLAFITVLGVVRLVLPIDFDAAYVVRSYKIIPAVEDFLKRPLAASFTYGHLLLALWAVGSLVMVIKDVRLQRRFDRYLQSIDFVDRPELLEIAAEYGNDFAVLISPQLHMPFTSGILHPVIYLPDVELSDAEWRMVFCHEITHIRSRDNLKKLFFLAIEALFWWNPVAHFSGTEINTLIELHCDVKTSKKMDERERFAYAGLLRRLLDSAFTNKGSSIISPLIGSSAEMSARFEALCHNGSKHEYKVSFFPVLLGLLFLASYFVIIQPARFPAGFDTISDSEELSLMIDYYVNIEENNSDHLIVCRDGQYYYYINDEFIGVLSDESITIPPLNSVQIIGG